MSACRSCGAEIFWAKTAEKGKSIPLDAQMVIGGNITIDGLIARVGAAGSGNYISHFTTCPNAKKHRKPKPGAHDGVAVRIEVKDV